MLKVVSEFRGDVICKSDYAEKSQYLSINNLISIHSMYSEVHGHRVKVLSDVMFKGDMGLIGVWSMSVVHHLFPGLSLYYMSVNAGSKERVVRTIMGGGGNSLPKCLGKNQYNILLSTACHD